jgi:hypothetical protein
MRLLPVTLAACDDLPIGGRIQVCLVFVSQGWGSVQHRATSVVGGNRQARCSSRRARARSGHDAVGTIQDLWPLV